MSKSHSAVSTTLVLVVLVLGVFAVLAIKRAEAADRIQSVTVERGEGSAGLQGRGQLLTNKPGGYYLGFVPIGGSFLRDTIEGPLNRCASKGKANKSSWFYRGKNCSDYLFGKVDGLCFWVGPTVTKKHRRSWWRTDGPASSGYNCTSKRRRALLNDRNVGTRFNCRPGENGNGPSPRIKLTEARDFYRNMRWRHNPANRDQYLANGPDDRVASLKAGTFVQYRFTTLDGGYNIVYVPRQKHVRAGWGFVATGAINTNSSVVRGHWTHPGNRSKKISCPADY